ncbi:MAG: hypothetical tRNA/rRNA methyltransferase [Phycisphaerae bacterium]|jgi:tRNA G18 (ribose-2'-O)-methylase SpoU|nr:MAG: hypothetical tRNA/rRNA methyltransferase [Phycisphaerae bacterium]
MNVTRLQDLSDPLVKPFCQLTRPDRRESDDYFLAEGEKVTIRLLTSRYACPRVLCAESRIDHVRPYLQPQTQLIVAPLKIVQDIVGFAFHSGVIGLGLRPEPVRCVPDRSMHQPIVVLPEITNPANLGALIRVSAAFGVQTILLGERCRDPFTRQTVRTSMGSLFSVQLVTSTDLDNELNRLQHHQIPLLATVLDPQSTPLTEVKKMPRFALLIGNEGPGLEPKLIQRCDQRITIPMQLGTDSLNVVVATGIFLYHLCSTVSGQP